MTTMQNNAIVLQLPFKYSCTRKEATYNRCFTTLVGVVFYLYHFITLAKLSNKFIFKCVLNPNNYILKTNYLSLFSG